MAAKICQKSCFLVVVYFIALVFWDLSELCLLLYFFLYVYRGIPFNFFEQKGTENNDVVQRRKRFYCQKVALRMNHFQLLQHGYGKRHAFQRRARTW